MRRNFSWVFFGTVTFGFSQWLLLSILAKLGGPAEVGRLILAQAVCVPIVWLTGLNLRAVLVSDARNEHAIGQYVALRIATALVTVVLIVCVSMLPRYDSSSRIVIVLVGIGHAVISVREIVLGVFNKHECMNVSAKSNICLGIVGLVAFAAVYLTTRSLALALTGGIVVRLSVLMFHDCPRATTVLRQFADGAGTGLLRPDWNLRSLRRLAWVSLPLGLAMTMSSLNNNIPILFLDAFGGKAATGFFGAIASFMIVAMMLMNSLGTATAPRLAVYFANDRPAFIRLVIRLILIGVFVGAAGVAGALLLGNQILRLAFTLEYAQYSVDFAWLMAAAGLMFVASFLNYALVGARAFRPLLAAWILVAVGCVGLSAWLIPSHGVRGAAWVRTATALLAIVLLASALWFRSRGRTGAVLTRT